MPDFLQRNPLVLVLGGFAIALLVVIGLETGWGLGRSGVTASAPPKPAPVDARLLPPLADAAAEQVYPETGTRPLFTPTRRPAPAAEAVGAMVKGQFVLQGVTIMGDTRIAMLREKNGSKVYRIEKGKDVNGITVADIEPERVTLRQGGDSEVVALTVQKPGAAAGAPAGATAGAPPAATGTVIGPFGAPVPDQQPATAMPGTMPGTSPAGAPPVPPASGAPRRVPGPTTAPGAAPGPMPIPNPAAGTPAPPTAANPSAAEAAMTPEELLARRRARRAQQSQ